MTKASRRATKGGKFSDQQILEATSIADENGYRAALDFLGSNYSGMSTYFMSGVRIDWIFHCYTPSRRARCLDLGSGWGSLCFPLTSFFDETVSLERNPTLVRFQRLRSEEDKTQSLRLLVGDNLSLPFRDGSFDLVAASGILEWAAHGREGDPRSLQVRLLKEARRCLKPGGCLHLGIENRFGLLYWFGGRDHTSLPFTSILPRKAADLVASHLLRDHGWTRYDTYTYSSRGYRSILREAGFGPVELQWAYPGYTYPKFAARLNDGRGYAFLARHHRDSYEDMSVFKKLACVAAELVPSRILGVIASMFWPSYLIFAWNGFRPKTIEDQVAEVVPSSTLVRMSGGDALNSKVSFVALADSEVRCYAKLSRCLQNEGLEEESRLLARYAGITPSKVPLNGLSVFVERPVSGRLCRVHGIEDSRKAVEWLLTFQDNTTSEPYIDDEAGSERSGMIDMLSKLVPKDIAESTNNQVRDFFSILVARKAPRCSEHGDFFPKNIIISEKGMLSVLDWEFYRSSGNPLFDFCSFILHNCLRPRAEISFYGNLLGLGDYSQVMSELIRKFCAHKRLPLEAFVLGMPYTISRRAVRYSVYSDTGSPLRNKYASLLTLWNKRMNNSDFSWIERGS